MPGSGRGRLEVSFLSTRSTGTRISFPPDFQPEATAAQINDPERVLSKRLVESEKCCSVLEAQRDGKAQKKVITRERRPEGWRTGKDKDGLTSPENGI